MKGNTAYKLPFTFLYCGTQYDTIYVDSHGFLMFDPNYSSSDYAYKSYLSYGYTGLAVLWKNYAYASGWVDTSVEGQVSFRFEMSYESGDTTYTWAHKTTLYSDGRIRFAYRQDANDSVPDNFAIGLAVGNMRADYSYASLPLAGDGDAIPSNDFVFMTYGVAEGFSWSSSYYDYSTYQYVPCLYGQSKTAGPVPFALKVTDSSDGSTVTNFYDFVIAENPDKEPVIDAVSPATTNVFHQLSIGDTMDFHVDAHDLADGPFDINWRFYKYDGSSYSTNLATTADFTFEATRELYDFQQSSGESILRCIVSDAFWTNSVSWHVYIRRDTYIDASAAEGGNGTEASPYNNLRDDYLKFGDKIIIAPGRYELDYMNLGSKGLQFVSTGTMDDTTIAFTSGYALSGNYGERASFTGFTFENVSGASYVNFTNCSLSGIKNRDYGIQDCDLTGCYVWGCSVSRNLFTDCTLADCTVAGNEITTTADEYDDLGAIGARCHMVNTIVVNNLADDGSEANFNPDEWSAREMSATNCCTIPAMTDYGPGNIEGQPSFVYATMGDLRLRAGSACLADNPANNTGAYKGPGVEGFTVHAFTDPVRGILSDGCDLQIVPTGETAYVMVKPLTDRAFRGWVTNGVEVAGATEMEFAIENIDCDYEVEALFEYKEFYVNPTEEDDTGDGSAAQPKRTVAAAAALALDEETIHLAEGSYEPFAFTSSTRITFLGAGAGRTIIDGGGTNTCVRLGSNATLKNASLVNGAAKSYAGGVYGGTIENCVVSNCTSISWYDCYGTAAYNATVVNSLIVNNVNTNSTSRGRAAGVSNCKVYNSTIANNVSSGYPGGAYYSHLKNCIVYGNTARSGYSEYNEIGNCRNETLSTGISDDIVAQSNLIGVDPWFVDAANRDWRLIAGSPAIDVGENVPQVSAPGALDLAGERRIRNGIVDYGCYEGGIVTGVPSAPVATGESAKAGNGLPFVWSAIPNAAEYRIYRGTVNDAASATLVGTTTATNYLDLATTGGTDYFYWISAYNAQFGESEKCGPIEVTSYADLKIETASLPAATEAVPYSVQLECSGNVGEATWSLPSAFVTREENTFTAATGVLVDDDWPTRDGSYQHNPIISLPFTFTWFGTAYDKVRLSEHGAIAFGDTGKSLSWSYYAIDETPKIAVLEGVSGWGDYTTISEIHVDTQADYVKISWTGRSDGYLAEFSATISADNTVRLSYGSCRGGGYIAYSNGSDESVAEILRKRADFSNMDDIVITGLPNDSGLAISEEGLLTGIIDFAGTYLVSALVTDPANGDTAYKTFPLTVNANANTRPVIDSATPAEGKVVFLDGDTQTFTVAAHDPEGAPLTYTWYLNDEVVQTGSSAAYAMTAPYAGVFSLACEVSDALWTNGQVYAEWDVYVGQKLYVDAASTAGEEADGTQAKPFKTLQEAVDWLAGGDTVFVAPGTYAPVRVFGGYMNDITFRATGSVAETIIDGNGAAYCLDDYHCAKEFTFVGFTIRNGGNPNVTGSASYGVNLKNCIVTGFVADRCIVYGADVEDCQIYGNTVTRYGSAVGFCNVTRTLIYNNMSGTYGAAYMSNLDHCTVYGNTAGIGGGMDGLSTATYSIVWGNNATNAGASATANYEPSTNGVQFTYSCTTPLPEGEGNIASDPLFVNAAGGDFRLADGSPCLEAGMGCYGEGGDTPPPVGVTYTVTFDANGGTCGTASRTVAKDAAIGTLPQATREGYTLDGWYTAKTAGTKVSATTKVTKDITLYARWTELPKFTVTFDANGGTCATKTLKVTQGEAVGELPEATRDGFKLAGWYTAKTGGALVTEATTVTKNITYYARWTEHYELVIEEGVLTGLTGTTPATIDVPATVTAFAANLFKGVTKITSATGGANVTKCGAGAFRDSGIWTAAPNGPVVVCGVLVGWKGTIPATIDLAMRTDIRVIADGALAGATTITTLYLPDSLVTIGGGAFKGCTKLDDVFGLEDGVTVAADAFEGTLYATFRLTWSGTVVTGFKGPCPAEIVIPDNATGIGVGAFQGQTAITSVTFEGTNVATIGANAFKGCTELATVTVGENLATIGASAFGNCTSLASFNTPETVTTIGASAFEGCTSIASFYIPKSVKALGAAAFKGCTALAEITGGEGFEEIRTDAFAGTPWYDAKPEEGFEVVMLGHVLVRAKGEMPESYEISTNVLMVANDAFAGVTTLNDLYIGTEVVSLWDRAFAGCTSLGSVTVPSGCREFGDYLFEGCTSLTNVYFRGHAPTNDVPHVFSGTPDTLTIRVKEGSRGWEHPGAESDVRPARWPNKTFESDWLRPVAADLSRAIANPSSGEEVLPPGTLMSIIVDGTITNDTTWTGGKVYEIQRGCAVGEDATLTIEPGAILKFMRNASFDVRGTLNAIGELARPIVFTSVKDDEWGGDTNGDGARSDPGAGDWGIINVYGTLNMNYCRIRHCNSSSDRGAIQGYSASTVVVFDNGVIERSAFECVRMNGGTFTAHNSVFRDSSMGFGYYGGKGTYVYNCVIADCTVGCRYRSKHFYNTIFYNCLSFYDQSGDYSEYTRCVFYNEPGVREQATKLVGKNGNIWANPLFLDAENGDYRISVESPCVDAAYGEVASEQDYYGQPRMDVPFVRNTGKPNAAGEYPDIGIYEVPGTTERPVMNLEVEMLNVEKLNVAPGETFTVNYTVRNTGTTAAQGSIRDTVRIKSAANGGTMTAGAVTQLYNLEAGGEAQFVATVTMPAAPAGEWLVGIDVNPNRDVFEQNFLKNSMWTADAVEVTLPEMTMGMTGNAAVPAATTVGYMLKDVPEEGCIVVITAAGTAALPVIARVAAGHMPTAAIADAVSFVRADGAVVIVVPPHAAGDQFYLAMENTGIHQVMVDVSVQELATELWSVYPLSAANVGDMGFTFTGSGLNAESGYYLGNIPAKSVTIIDSANVHAVFDVQGIPADRYYDIRVADITMRDAIRIDKVAKGPILEAKLELPERTRDNRIYTGYVVYENKGDTQMNAPTLIINIAEASSTNTVIGAYDDDDDNLTQQRVLIVGLGSSHPAGILKPGDSGRLPFKFRPVGSYQFKLDSRYTSDEVAGAVTRMNLRGGPVRFDGYSARGLANLAKKGETAAAVSGHLLDVRTREPLAGAALKLALKTGNGEESFVRVVTTDDDGYFSFEQLKDGAYTLVADKGYALATTNVITVAGQADVNGYEAMAVPPGIVSGYVIGEDGTVVQYGEVTLFRSANDMSGETLKTDGFGAYRFAGLDDGEYAVFAKPYELFKGQLATNLVISTAARENRLDFVLRQTARAFGTVTHWKGGTAGAGEVRFYNEDGNYLKTEVSTNGTWEAQGLEPGEYSVTYVSADGTFESGFVAVALAKGDETEIPLQAIPATPFELSTTFGVIDGATYKDLTVYFAATGYASDTNVASVVWNFGDGSETFETNAVETAHVYTSTGLFAVSVTPRYEDGTLGDEFVLHNCLCITNELETIYKANAILLGGYATEDADDRKDAGTLVVTGVGEDWVTLTGAPGAVSLAAGTVIAGPYKDEKGEDDWFLRKIVGVTGDETSGWRLATEHGNEEDLYEQYWFYGSAGVEEKAPTRGGRAASPKGGRNLLGLPSIGEGVANLLKKTSGSIEKGIEFEVDCSPDLHYHYSCKITSNDWRQVWKTFRREDVLVWENLGPRRRELHIWGDVSLKADITATAEFKGGWEDEQEYELIPKAVSTLPSAAKAIPYFTIGYSASGTVTGSATATAEVKGHLNVGFVKESDKKIEWYKTKPFDGNVDISFDADEGIDASVKLEASVSAGFGVKVKAFEVVSASADVKFNATAAIECPKNSPSKASASIGYDTTVAMNFIDLSWLNKDWKVGMDWTIEGPTLWSVEWISAKPNFIYRQPHAKEWPARITVTDRSEWGTYADARGRTFPIPIRSVDWDYGQGQTFHYGQAQIDSGEYKKHRTIEFPADQDEGEYTVSLNVQGGIAPSLWPCQKKIKIKKPEEPEEQTKIQKEEWFGPVQSTQKSHDPNEMAGPKGVGEQRYVKPGEPMTYTIYFENKADAAIAAQEVFVDNALSEYLDWSTFEMKTVSVGGQILDGLDGWKAEDIAAAGGTAATEIDQTNGLYKTRVEVQYDATEGIASWYIRVVDPVKRTAGDGECWPDDPDAGVLQPNVVSPEGEGYIVYSVCVREDAPANAIIDNSANIVFDQNAAIITDPAWWNTVYGGTAGVMEPEIVVDEGSNAVIRVVGGNESSASSVKVYLTYNTATAADLNLGTVKFPITLKWAAGEIGERVVTIPVKADALYEGDEFFTVQLAGASGMDIGDDSFVTVVIRDANEFVLPEGAVEFEGGYYVVDKKGNATAKALYGYVFVAWVYDSNGKTYSTKAAIPEKTRKSKMVHPLFAPVGYLRALSGDPAGGTVKGQGMYAMGKTVTLTAAPKKGYAFTGWRTLGETASIAATYKYTVDDGLQTVVATFRKESELERPVLTLSDTTGETSSQEASGNDREISVGVAYPAELSVSAESKVSITKVAGLPTGLKYKSGKITGVPTKAGKFTASAVVALASNKKKTWVCKVPFEVVALPEWARGNFTGAVESPDTGEMVPATMSVGTTGKVSGKFALGGTNWTFSASSFAKESVVTGEVVRFVAAMNATGTWKDKSGKKTVTKTAKLPLGFALVADPGTSAIASTTENGYFGTDDTETEEDEAGTVEFRRNAGVSVTKSGETDGGTVSLSAALGQAASNKTVKATAKLSKGYALLGWYLVESGETNLVSQALSYSVKMSGSDVFLVAAFAKEGGLARPVVTWSDPYRTVEVDAATAPAATNYVGVSYPAALSVTGDAKVSISKVTGLPTGLSYKGGKITGVPTKAGAFTPVVTVALSTNAKKTWAYKFPMVIVALPAYARGSFTGGVMPGGGEAAVGLATVDVGSTGKISGKFYEGGTNWTLSAASYGLHADDAFVCSNLTAKYSWNEKRGKKTIPMSAVRTFVLNVDESSNGDTVLGCATAEEVVAEGDGASLMAWQDLWGSKYKAIGSALFSTSAKAQYKTWPSVEADGLGEYDSLSMKVTAAGAVTATYRYFRGTFDAKGAPQYATYTCSTTLVPTTSADAGADAFAGVAPVFLPPVASTGFTGYYVEVHYPFKEREVPVPSQE